MRYNTFRNLLLTGVAVAVVGGGIYIGRRGSSGSVAATPADKPATPAPPETVPAPVPAADPKPPAPPAVRGAAETSPTTARGLVQPQPAAAGPHGARTPLRELDRELLQLAAPGAKRPRLKDAFPKSTYKINVYEEGGQLVRAKVDLDRNGKWDEKWTFEQENGASVVKRHVSPADDDTNYTLTYKLAGEAWVQK